MLRIWTKPRESRENENHSIYEPNIKLSPEKLKDYHYTIQVYIEKYEETEESHNKKNL